MPAKRTMREDIEEITIENTNKIREAILSMCSLLMCIITIRPSLFPLLSIADMHENARTCIYVGVRMYAYTHAYTHARLHTYNITSIHMRVRDNKRVHTPACNPRRFKPEMATDHRCFSAHTQFVLAFPIQDG